MQKTSVPDEVMQWLQKSGSITVSADNEQEEFDRKTAEIERDILWVNKATEAVGTEIVVEVRLAKAREFNTTMILTIVYVKEKKKYIIFDEKTQKLKRVQKVGCNVMLCVNDDEDATELLETIKTKQWRFFI